MQKLCTLIKEAQDGNNNSMEILITQFKPLLLSASRRIDYEDTLSELQLFLFLLLKNLDLSKLQSSSDSAIATYIKKAVYHQIEFIGRKIAKDRITCNYEDLSDFEEKRCDVKNSIIDTYDELLVEDLKKYLTLREEVVIKKHFLKCTL